MPTTFTMKFGDTEPTLDETLTDSLDQAVDVSGTTVALHLRAPGAITPMLSATATIVNGPAGQVRYTWPTPQALSPGVYYGEWQVTWTDGTIISFPNDSYFRVLILPALTSTSL